MARREANPQPRKTKGAARFSPTAAEASLRLLVSQMPALVWATDTDLRVTSLLGDVRLVGLDRPTDRIVGSDLFTIFGTRDPDFAPIAAHRRALSGEAVTYERETARGRVLHIHVEPLRDSGGAIVGTAGIGFDVTERRQAEEALRESEERYRRLFEQNVLGIYLTTVDGRILEANPALVRMLGFPSFEDLAKRNLEKEGFESEGGRAEFRRRLEAGGEVVGLESVWIRRDGSRLAVRENARAMRDASGRICCYEGTVEDITAQKRAEDERRQLEARVQQARKLESLGLMAGSIAHDFNNLLASILGNANLALMDLPETASGARESLEQVEKAARRAAELTGHLLAYSGKGRFLTTAVDLSNVAAEMSRLLKVSVGAGAKLVCDVAPDLPPIEADATQVRQTIMNLIANASDAIGAGPGVISVSTGLVEADAAYLADVHGTDAPAPGCYVYVEVSDTGRGIDDEMRARLFDPFFSTRATGRGLGLSVVLGIVRAHHGAIKITSASGGGTTFRVLFPPASAEAKPAAGPRPRHDGPSAGMVLVVDDDAAVRQMVRMALERFGFSVLAAGGGREGIGLFRTRGPEIGAVLLDVTMPDMGGDEVFAEIRRMRPDVPIILSSGYAETETTVRLAGAGRVGFLQKPYLPTALVEKIREVLSA